MLLDPIFEKALNKACVLHDKKYRKTPANLPYISHSLAVTLMVSKITDSQDILIASLLHDTLENTDYTSAQLEDDFGEKIANIVREVTETKEFNGKVLEWSEIKATYVETLKNASYEALLLALADKTHDLQMVLKAYKAEGQRAWLIFGGDNDKHLAFYTDCLNIFRQGLKSDILSDYEALHATARKLWAV